MKYVKNKELLELVIQSKKDGCISTELQEFLNLLAEQFIQRKMKAYYSPYYCDLMLNNAKVILKKGILKFDENKSLNPFSYASTVINGAAYYALATERKNINRTCEINNCTRAEYNWFCENLSYYTYRLTLTKPIDWVYRNLKYAWFLDYRDQLYIEDKKDYILARLAN